MNNTPHTPPPLPSGNQPAANLRSKVKKVAIGCAAFAGVLTIFAAIGTIAPSEKKRADDAKESSQPAPRVETPRLTDEEKAGMNRAIVLAKSAAGADLSREETALLSKIRAQEAVPSPPHTPQEEAVIMKLAFNQRLTTQEEIDIDTKFKIEAIERKENWNYERKIVQTKALGYAKHMDSIHNAIRWQDEGDNGVEARKRLIYKDSFNDDYRVENIVDGYVIYINKRSHRKIALVKRAGVYYGERSPLANSCFAFVGMAEFSRVFGGNTQLPVFEDMSDKIKSLRLIE
jgi:hypothetical protein